MGIEPGSKVPLIEDKHVKTGRQREFRNGGAGDPHARFHNPGPGPAKASAPRSRGDTQIARRRTLSTSAVPTALWSRIVGPRRKVQQFSEFPDRRAKTPRFGRVEG